MSDYLHVLALALLPAAGNFAGGILAEAVHVSERTLSLALHFAAGLLLTVVVEEMVTEAHRDRESRLAALLLVGGFALFAAILAYVG